MLKKVSALILAAMLSASLTACGGSNTNTSSGSTGTGSETGSCI